MRLLLGYGKIGKNYIFHPRYFLCVHDSIHIEKIGKIFEYGLAIENIERYAILGTHSSSDLKLYTLICTCVLLGT